MLTHLSIQGLAIIDSLSIEWSPGYNVITGETGAGKSILIRGLNLLLGAKASAEAVRKGYEQASVCGQFSLSVDHRCGRLLREFGLPFDQQGDELSVVIRRVLTAKGRSQAWINDTPVTLSTLRQVTETLCSIIGQHENQSLLDANQHLLYVDRFLANPDLVHAVQTSHQQCVRLLREIQELLATYNARQKDKDYLLFRREELAAFAPTVEDYERLLGFCRNAEKSLVERQSLVKVQACIDEGCGGEGVSRPVWEAVRVLERLGDPRLSALKQTASELASRLDDLSFEIGRAVGKAEFCETDLEQAQERVAGYQRLIRKFGVADVLSLVGEFERIERDLSFVETAVKAIGAKMADLSRASRDLKTKAGGLSQARRKAAERAISLVQAELKELAMGGARMEVAFIATRRPLPDLNLCGMPVEFTSLWAEAAEVLADIGENGGERAQFLLAPNPGEPALPIQRVASGGELSRFMLALKKALASDDEPLLLVFDEVDTGISGKVADVVGRKMRELANGFQVVSISHLPQVAAYAQAHFLVQKHVCGERTESRILRLSAKETAEEIARLLSGTEITTPSLANAKSLLKQARQS